METINVAICWKDSGNEYSKFPATTIISILENNKSNDIKFFLISKDIPLSSKNKINKMLKNYKAKYEWIVEFKKKDGDFVEKLYEIKSVQWGIGTYYDLLLPSILPKKIKKVLYLDTDTLVREDLSKIWEIPIEKDFIAGVADKNWEYKASLFGLKKYVNAGVLLFNLENIRKIKNLNKNCLDFSKKYLKLRTGGDQDIVNYVFRKGIIVIDKKYNYMLNSKNKWKYFSEGAIFHYTYLKPWINPCFINKKYIKEYFKYIDKTPWANWRPKRNLKKGIIKTLGISRKIVFMSEKLKVKNTLKKVVGYK